MENKFKADDFYTYKYFKEKLGNLSSTQIFDRYWRKLTKDDKPMGLANRDEKRKFIQYITDLMDDKYPMISNLPYPDKNNFRLQIIAFLAYRPDGYEIKYDTLFQDYTNLLTELKNTDEESFTSFNMSDANSTLNDLLGAFLGFANRQKLEYFQSVKNARNNAGL